MEDSSQSWREIERGIGRVLPEAVRRLYERTPHGEASHHDEREAAAGAATREGRCMRLLSPSEVCEIWKLYSSGGAPLRGGVPLWVSNNGDYAFVFCEGPLVGKVFWIDYALQRTPAVYRSVDSFHATMNAFAGDWPSDEQWDDADWYDLPTDYVFPGNYYHHGKGVPLPTTADEAAWDLEVRAALEREWRSQTLPEDEDERCRWVCHYANNFCALTPPDRLADLLPILRHEAGDEWGYAQAFVAEILGFRRAEFAVDALKEVARNGRGNGSSAALRSLGLIGTREAKNALRHLAAEGVEGAEAALQPVPPSPSLPELYAALASSLGAYEGLAAKLAPEMDAELSMAKKELGELFAEIGPPSFTPSESKRAKPKSLAPAAIAEMAQLAAQNLSPEEREEFEKTVRTYREFYGSLRPPPS